ncbi:MAG: hypothetical protein JWP11_34 [Frankiales bacterium]|nr:hypothetical protein [Frankiales bacterium]
MRIAVHNSSSAPVVVDDGRVIGAGEFGVADSTDATEVLRKFTVADDAEDVDPAAATAVTEAAEQNAAAKAAKEAAAKEAAAADAVPTVHSAVPPDGTGDQPAPKSSRSSRGA